LLVNASLLMKVALALGILYYVRRGAPASPCAGKANLDACGAGMLCFNGKCVPEGRWTGDAYEDGGNFGSTWLDPSTWGSPEDWLAKLSDAFNGPTETPPNTGPVTSTNDPRLGGDS
jgi:hypothetical protein